MVILFILDIVWWLVESVYSVVLPLLPVGFGDVLTTIFELFTTGASFVIYFFSTPRYLSFVFSFLIDSWILLRSIDLVWKLISTLKARRDSN